MSDSSAPVEIVLEDEAKTAVAQIASLLGGATEEQAVQRALGTELYLLHQVRFEKARVWVESARGRFELDLIGQ